ncbi:hypothetical protein B484DRAFT_398337 [Ochromonadaceae sp. CCMP2298]|nr:hypothetical protein B484DRAFT_398337 [Ochromonadaceae sp. CCMP2298]
MNEVPPGADPAPKTSHLPSWVLKMREKIEVSRSAHAAAESALLLLSENMDVLSEKLLVMLPRKRDGGGGGAGGVVCVGMCVGGANSEKQSEQSRRRPFYALPADVVVLVLEYLRVGQVVQLHAVSRALQAALVSSPYWQRAFALFSHLHTSQPPDQSSVRRYLRSVGLCATFLRTMKDQRCTPKHRSVQPRRHTKQERQVTHPLPLFGGRGAGGSGGGGREGQELVMSHAETLSTDFRSVAHRSLQALLALSADPSDPAIYQLVSDGAVTVLASLLSNEEAALQNYACGILANLLCWEAREMSSGATAELQQCALAASASAAGDGLGAVMANASSGPTVSQRDGASASSRNALAHAHAHGSGLPLLLTLEKLFGMTACRVAELVPVGGQLRACGAHRLLADLLTSPTASINLAGGTRRPDPATANAAKAGAGAGTGAGAGMGVVGASAGGTTSQAMETRIQGTASVQGMCNKQASRALLALFYPQISVLTVPVSAVSVSTAPVSVPVVSESLPSIGGLFTSDRYARPWQFTHFHKSGSFKDQYTCYLRFLPSCAGAAAVESGSGRSGVSGASGAASGGSRCVGRGRDAIGLFRLRGFAEVDIAGWTWHLHKTYLRTDAELELGNLGQLHLGGDGGDGVVEGIHGGYVGEAAWIQMLDGADEGQGAQGSSGSHVTHVGYWSPGVESRTPIRSGVGACVAAGAGAGVGVGVGVGVGAGAVLDSVDESQLGVWGVGLWGVWETSSSATPHFELQKGGVFRAAPLIICH